MTLATTLAALEKGDHATALNAALEAWNTCRDARIAAVIDELSVKLASTRLRPAGKTVADKQTQWLKLAAANDPADIANLLATLADVRKWAPLQIRLDALDGRSDPRIATALQALLLQAPIPGATGADSLRKALAMIVAIADPRSIDALATVAEALETGGGGLATHALRGALPSGREHLDQAVAKVVAVLGVDESETLDRIEAALTAKRAVSKTTGNVEELFAAVYANPADDGARSVLADFLQERGDPRGELIALQLARTSGGPRTKRESELLRTYAREWLGPIAPVVLETGMAYERGFLAKCAVHIEYVHDGDKLAFRPEWATVREVDVSSWRWCLDLLQHMPDLRVLRGIHDQLPDHAVLEDVAMQMFDDGSVERLCTTDAPALRRLAIESAHATAAGFRPFWSSKLCSQLASLELTVSRVETWIREVANRNACSIAIADRIHNPWRMTFAGGTVSVVHRFPAGIRPEATDDLVKLLRHIPTKCRVIVATALPTSTELVTALSRFASHELAATK